MVLNHGPHEYQADALTIELSRLGLKTVLVSFLDFGQLRVSNAVMQQDGVVLAGLKNYLSIQQQNNRKI